MFVLPDGRVVIPRTELTYPGIPPETLRDKTVDPLKLSRNAADPVRAPVDHVMGDMEDACPAELKGEPVRAALAEAFTTLDFGPKVVTFRPNNIQTQWFAGDIEHMMRKAKDRVHGIVLPKPFTADDVRYAIDVLDFCEKLYGWSTKVWVEVLIETPAALRNIDAIAETLERTGRGAGLIFGIADFASFIGVGDIVEDQHIKFAYAKQAVVIAAKAHGLHAIDNVYLRLPKRGGPPETLAEIERGLRQKNQWAASFGMDGTWVIHPSQAAIANECFTPTDQEVATHKRILELSEKSGGGAIADPVTGMLIDDATLRIALQALSKAAQAGKVSWEYVAAMNQRITERTGYSVLKAKG